MGRGNLSSPGNPPALPHVFHRIWVGSQIPEEFERYGDTWTTHHPGWSMMLWTEDTIPLLENQAYYDQAETIAPNNVGQLRADIARYEILWRYGGIYIDTDFECLKPIDDLIEGAQCFAAWERQDVWIANGLMGAIPRHPFISRLIDGIPQSIEANPGARPAKSTGPQYLTRLYQDDPMDMKVLDEKHVYPYSWRELHRRAERFPDAYAVHHWNNRRRRG